MSNIRSSIVTSTGDCATAPSWTGADLMRWADTMPEGVLCGVLDNFALTNSGATIEVAAGAALIDIGTHKVYVRMDNSTIINVPYTPGTYTLVTEYNSNINPNQTSTNNASLAFYEVGSEPDGTNGVYSISLGTVTVAATGGGAASMVELTDCTDPFCSDVVNCIEEWFVSQGGTADYVMQFDGTNIQAVLLDTLIVSSLAQWLCDNAVQPGDLFSFDASCNPVALPNRMGKYYKPSLFGDVFVGTPLPSTRTYHSIPFTAGDLIGRKIEIDFMNRMQVTGGSFLNANITYEIKYNGQTIVTGLHNLAPASGQEQHQEAYEIFIDGANSFCYQTHHTESLDQPGDGDLGQSESFFLASSGTISGAGFNAAGNLEFCITHAGAQTQVVNGIMQVF